MSTKRVAKDIALRREIEQKINQKDPTLLQGLSPDKKQKLIEQVIVSYSSEHQGPLPDPETLSRYDQIIPNGAERIMAMAEKQSDHRQKMEETALRRQFNQSGTGQIFALAIGLFTIGCSTYSIVQGFELAGGFLGVGGVTGLVLAFIRGKDHQRRDLQQKRRPPQ